MATETVPKAAERRELGTLPDGWRMVRFDQIAENVTERVDNPSEAGVEYYVGLEHLDPESLHIRRWGKPDDVEATKLRFQPGDIIFGRRRAYQRKLAIAEFEGICSAHALVLRTREDTVVKGFLPFLMQSDAFFERAMAISVGSLSPTINWSVLARQEFALPPKDEQRRIAEILWAADESIERYRIVRSALESCRQATETELLISSSKSSTLHQIPENLSDLEPQVAALGHLAEVSYGLTINATRRVMPVEKPYLRVANVQRDRLDLAELKTIGCRPEDIERFALQQNDVLVVEGHANVEEIGRASIWNSEIDECLHQNHILRVRCSSALNPKYLTTYLNSTDGRAYFRRRAKSTSGLNTINSTVLREMPVPVRSLEEQTVIVRAVEKFEDGWGAIATHLKQQLALKKALLVQLLSHGQA